jgi:asparagine synthase (glutamine-hydrolysing)
MTNSSLPALPKGSLDAEEDFLTHLQRLDLTNYLPCDILTKVDRMTMAHGLESRTPFLHPEIIEFGLSLPQKYKISHQGQLNYILRVLAEQKFGKPVASAKKQGFSVPLHRWLRHEARDLLLDCLSPSNLAALPFLNGSQVLKAVDAHLKGKQQLGFELWGLMVLVTWYHQKVQNPYYIFSLNRLEKVDFSKRHSS